MIDQHTKCCPDYWLIQQYELIYHLVPHKHQVYFPQVKLQGMEQLAEKIYLENSIYPLDNQAISWAHQHQLGFLIRMDNLE